MYADTILSLRHALESASSDSDRRTIIDAVSKQIRPASPSSARGKKDRKKKKR